MTSYGYILGPKGGKSFYTEKPDGSRVKTSKANAEKMSKFTGKPIINLGPSNKKCKEAGKVMVKCRSKKQRRRKQG